MNVIIGSKSLLILVFVPVWVSQNQTPRQRLESHGRDTVGEEKAANKESNSLLTAGEWGLILP